MTKVLFYFVCFASLESASKCQKDCPRTFKKLKLMEVRFKKPIYLRTKG
jgi:hypothetical protein